MAGFSWFERKPGQGNILDPLGLMSSKKSQATTDRIIGTMGFGNESPMMRAARGENLGSIAQGITQPNQFVDPKKNENTSMDQKVGSYLDPGGFFGNKEATSYVGPSRLEGNLGRFESDPSNAYSFNYAPLVNNAATQVDLNNQSRPQSTYAGLLDRKFY